MGGVPLLVIAAAMGITYGWQPNKNEGVDYIVQISPDQVDDFRRTGEFSSVIDPAVRGHVSRVVIKVGNESLPRITPQGLGAQRPPNTIVAQASADLEAVPTPEIAAAKSAAVLMKPDVNDGPGLALPNTLPPSLTGGDSGTRDGMAELSSRLAEHTREGMRRAADSAKAAAANAPNPALEAMRAAASDARTANPQGNLTNTRRGVGPAGNLAQTQVPAFTGNNDPVGRIRTGGPSTAPTAKRDNTWFDSNAKTQPTGPSTAPVNRTRINPALVGPPDLRPSSLLRQTTAQNQAAPAPTTQPLGSTSTFAHIPDSFVNPNTKTPASTNRPTAGLTEYQRAQYELLLRQQQQQRTGLATDALTSGNAPINVARTNTRPETGYGLGQRSANNPTNNVLTSVDPRLTQAEIDQLPYGGWSFDAYGNPIDEKGQILDRYGRVVSRQQAYDLTQGRAASTTDYERSLLEAQQAYSARNTARPLPDRGFDRVAQARLNPPSDVLQPTPPPPVSPSDRVRSASQTNGDVVYRTDKTTVSPRQTLAAQPLFNGLLLFSIVANVYLVFWLKNLRHQFHDLVAAKRAATSEVTA